MANIFNPKHLPPGFTKVRQKAVEAQAYYDLQPYPWFAFQDWKTEDRGPLPRCMPFIKWSVKKGARWLFGKPVQILVPGNQNLEAIFQEAWKANRMPTKMVMAARKAAIEGGIAIKFSYDKASREKIKFQILSVKDQVIFYYDPHDKEKLVLARIQYPYYDATLDSWYWYREDWTVDTFTQYEIVPDELARNAVFRDSNPYTSALSDPMKLNWQIKTQQPNQFGVIPVINIKNEETEHQFGCGDWWGLERVVDRVNLVYHLMDRSNQFDSDPIKVFIDAQAENDDLEDPLPPGSSVSLKSIDDKRAQALMLETSGKLRDAMMESVNDIKDMLFDTVGAVKVRADEVTNKGNLTAAVLTQLYAPLIEVTEDKRKLFGEDGICKLLEQCAIALKNVGASEAAGVRVDNFETYNTTLVWPPFFDLTAEEISQEISNQSNLLNAGLTTQERAAQRLAGAMKVEDPLALLEELKSNQKQGDDLEQSSDDAPETKGPRMAKYASNKS